MNNTSKSAFIHILTSCLAGLLLAACAVPAPVQEMSNARQSLQAAKEVKAELLAPGRYARARQLLDDAAKNLENGDYHQAKGYALEAKIEANQARQTAINMQKK
ncbi:MAG: DUF4398 domain-containing protein [Gammaproteobacteria bacterium]|nr:DUF4398 domain-containing protein [Gammaproteobacteria bacterium]MDH5650970.1 DUF4398 domain-containing protein [Gammaproteobacteria bacterium]